MIMNKFGKILYKKWNIVHLLAHFIGGNPSRIKTCWKDDVLIISARCEQCDKVQEIPCKSIEEYRKNMNNLTRII